MMSGAETSLYTTSSDVAFLTDNIYYNDNGTFDAQYSDNSTNFRKWVQVRN